MRFSASALSIAAAVGLLAGCAGTNLGSSNAVPNAGYAAHRHSAAR